MFAVAESETTHRSYEISLSPDLREARRHELVGERCYALHEVDRARAEGLFDSLPRTKQIRRHAQRRALYVAEEQGRATGRDDAAMNFGELKSSINGGVDHGEFAASFELP